MTRLIKTVVIAALLSFPAAAVAQVPEIPEAPRPGGPSPWTAQVLSALGAAVPLGMIVLGSPSGDGNQLGAGLLLLIPGPSIGYFYGRRPWRGLTSAGVRLAGAAGLIGSVAICWNPCSGSDYTWGAVLGWGGVGLMAAAAIYDVVRVGPDVRRANELRAARVTPTVDLAAEGMRLGLAVRF